MHHSNDTFLPFHALFNHSQNKTTSHLTTSTITPLSPSLSKPLLSFDMRVNSTTLYLGQYYKVTFSLKNNTADPITCLEINCDLQREWHLLNNNSFMLPAYITQLEPDETLNFTLTLQLIRLPIELPYVLNSYVSYHINGDSVTYIKNSPPINFTIDAQQASLNLSVKSRVENVTSYELLIRNEGTASLMSPVLYIFMPPSIHLTANSLYINEAAMPHLKPNEGIHLPDMPPQTIYIVRLATVFSPGHPTAERPKLQLVSRNLMFYPLPPC